MKTDGPEPRSRWQKLKTMGGVSHRQLMLFTKNFWILLKSGSTMSESIQVLKQQAKGKMIIILEEIHTHIQGGGQMSEIFKKYPRVFSTIYVALIEIGEQSGTLEQSLQYIGDQLQKSYEIKRKVWGAMLYPLIVIISTVLISIGIIVFVLPKIVRLFDNFKVELGWSTRLLIAISRFFETYGLWAVATVVFSAAFLLWLIRQRFMRPITHWFILRLPIVKEISIHFNMAMFCRTLGTLLKSGITIDDAMLTCGRTMRNYYYNSFFLYAHGKVKAGGSLTRILREKPRLFPSTDIQILRVGEKSGSLADSLKYCADLHEEAVDDITKGLANILEPLLLIGLGLMVAFVALSIITPLYSITGQFKR